MKKPAKATVFVLVLGAALGIMTKKDQLIFGSASTKEGITTHIRLILLSRKDLFVTQHK
jgi:hypothetical protein